MVLKVECIPLNLNISGFYAFGMRFIAFVFQRERYILALHSLIGMTALKKKNTQFILICIIRRQTGIKNKIN